MTVAFDNTMLSILLNPEGDIPNDPATGAPVVEAKARAEFVLIPIPEVAKQLPLQLEQHEPIPEAKDAE